MPGMTTRSSESATESDWPDISVRIDTPTQLAPADDTAAITEALAAGTVHQLGRIPHASNDTRLVTVTAHDTVLRAVYKPAAGERPLHDFPHGTLAGREVACFELGRAIGLPVAPPTVMRTDLAAGPGSLQAYVEALNPDDALIDVFAPEDVPSSWAAIFSAVSEDGEDLVVAHALAPALRDIALFDLIANNADRKASHILSGHYRFDGAEPAMFGIDHGLTFHAEPKLRTVLWGVSGESFTPAETRLLAAVAEDPELTQLLQNWLTEAEAVATAERAAALLDLGSFPLPPSTRTPIPWPPL
nr:SCO1664 family protein [Brevibacterium otitidis]